MFWSMEMDVTVPETDQDRVVLCPEVMVVGFVVKEEMEGRFGITTFEIFALTDSTTVFPATSLAVAVMV